jgi:hypothetical protein
VLRYNLVDVSYSLFCASRENVAASKGRGVKPSFSEEPKERKYVPIKREGAVRRKDEHADGVGVASATEVS